MFAEVLGKFLKRHCCDMITWLNQNDIDLRFRILESMSVKKVFLKISQNWQENFQEQFLFKSTCVGCFW